MTTLSVLAQDSTKTTTDRSNYDTEFQSLKDSLDQVFEGTFGGQNLFGAASGTATQSGFDGLYAPGSWTFADTAPGGATSGSVDTSSAPGSITLTGPSGPATGPPLGASNSDYTVTAIGSGTVTFDWNYSSTDTGNKDTGGYILNGTYVQVAANNSQGSGSASFSVNAGDTVGFSVRSTDSKKGPGVLAVSNFVAPLSAGSGGARTVTIDSDGSTLTLENIEPISVSGSVATISAASSALTEVKTALEGLARRQAIVGATLAVLQLHHDTMSVFVENLRAATSLAMDTDYAQESIRLAKQLMLSQAGTAMLGQANILPQTALTLLPQ